MTAGHLEIIVIRSCRLVASKSMIFALPGGLSPPRTPQGPRAHKGPKFHYDDFFKIVDFEF